MVLFAEKTDGFVGLLLDLGVFGLPWEMSNYSWQYCEKPQTRKGTLIFLITCQLVFTRTGDGALKSVIITDSLVLLVFLFIFLEYTNNV